jgi:hypothetical protein
VSAAEEAAKLRAQADAVELVGGLSDAYDAAMAAFRADRSAGNKAAWRAAGDALSAAREEQRNGRTVVLYEPGSAVITPGGLSVSGRSA